MMGRRGCRSKKQLSYQRITATRRPLHDAREIEEGSPFASIIHPTKGSQIMEATQVGHGLCRLAARVGGVEERGGAHCEATAGDTSLGWLGRVHGYGATEAHLNEMKSPGRIFFLSKPR